MNERRPDLVVIGDLNPDAIVAGAAIEPAFGQAERLAESGVLALGGSGGIVSSAAARLGLAVAHVGVVGDDAAGRFVLGELRARGVDLAWCRVDRAVSTGITVALSRGDDRAMLTAPGAIAALRPEDVPAAAIARARHVHVSSFYLQTGLQDGVVDLLARARAAGATTSLDCGWDPREEWAGGLDAALGQTDIFLPNAEEACRIAGTDDVHGALESLAARVATVAIKLGERGAVARSSDASAAAGPPPVEMVDATGAGDSFAAGFLHGHLDGRPLSDMTRLAVACGALSTRALGGVAAQPTLDEALAAAAQTLEREPGCVL
jgi:sugar/nucleoside kinase (ribokinase family)